MKRVELWALWRTSDNTPLQPVDENPGCDDVGMLVYRSRSAAEQAAEHQSRVWGAGDIYPKRLGEVELSQSL